MSGLDDVSSDTVHEAGGWPNGRHTFDMTSGEKVRFMFFCHGGFKIKISNACSGRISCKLPA